MDRQGGLASLVDASPILKLQPPQIIVSPVQNRALQGGRLLRLTSADGMNRLTHWCMLALTETVGELASREQPLIIAGNSNFFSVGADLNEISRLSGPEPTSFQK